MDIKNPDKYLIPCKFWFYSILSEAMKVFGVNRTPKPEAINPKSNALQGLEFTALNPFFLRRRLALSLGIDVVDHEIVTARDPNFTVQGLHTVGA